MIRDNISFAHRNVAHLSIVYELGISSIDLKLDFTPGNCLFEAMNLTKNVDPDKYGYGGEGIEFDACSQFSLSNGDGVKMLLFLEFIIVLPRMQIIQKTDILVLGKLQPMD